MFINAITNLRTFSLAFVMVAMLMVGTIATADKVHAQSSADLIEQLNLLLQQVADLQQQLQLQTERTVSVVSQSDSTGQCVSITRSMYLGSNDVSTAGQVSRLQQFLTSTGYYTYGEITGYFGQATQQAVQRWQAANGVVSSGTPDSTGFGLVGIKTRAALNSACKTSIPVQVEVMPVQAPQESMIEFDESYDIEITSPRSGSTAYTGDTIMLTWDENNLNNERAIVTLSRSGYTVDLKEYVDVGDQGVRVTLPEYRELGLVTETSYELKLWVSYVKDGSAKAVSDVVKINLKPRFASTEDLVNDLLDDVDDTYDSTKDCSIESNKDSVVVGEPFTIAWGTNMTNWYSENNPSFSNHKGEYQVDKFGSEGFVGKEIGLLEFGLGSSKDGTVCSVEVEVVGSDVSPVINSYEAKLDGRSDKYSPYLFFIWSTTGVSNCSIFLNDQLLWDNLPANSAKLLSRHQMNENYSADYLKNNDTELRCQAANTLKDSTVSEFDSVYMGSDYNESYTDEYKGYMDGRLFITTQDITKTDAYENCEMNAKNNTDSEVECTWGGERIYTTANLKG